MSIRKKPEPDDLYVDPRVASDPDIDTVLHQLRRVHNQHTLLLSERQFVVLDCYLMDLSYHDIAESARISVDVVRSTLRDIAAQLDCTVPAIKQTCRARGWQVRR